MAHGKKRWIIAYDGKIKKSNDRTKKDYYRDLRWWEPHQSLWKVWGRRDPAGEFCPQCKHFFKAVKAHNDYYEAVSNQIRDEYVASIQDKIEKYEVKLAKWNKYAVSWRESWGREWHWETRPKDPREDYAALGDYRRKNEHRMPPKPIRDEETFLCPKHRRKFDKKAEMWYRNHVNGCKDRYGWSVRQNYRDYRSEMKNIMRRAKYDESYYDDLAPYKHNWLD